MDSKWRLVLLLIAVVGPTARAQVDGDFNDDGLYDCTDINMINAAVVSGFDPLLDLNQDLQIDSSDGVAWLDEAGVVNIGFPYIWGDGNLDGYVDVSDFMIWNNHKFQNLPEYCSGDYDFSGDIVVSDFGGIWNGNKFTSSFPNVVPEPQNWYLVLLVAPLLHPRNGKNSFFVGR